MSPRKTDEGQLVAKSSFFSTLLFATIRAVPVQLELRRRRPQAQAKQSRAEGVPLFDTFGLTDASGNWALLPDERRRAT